MVLIPEGEAGPKVLDGKSQGEGTWGSGHAEIQCAGRRLLTSDTLLNQLSGKDQVEVGREPEGDVEMEELRAEVGEPVGARADGVDVIASFLDDPAFVAELVPFASREASGPAPVIWTDAFSPLLPVIKWQ